MKKTLCIMFLLLTVAMPVSASSAFPSSELFDILSSSMSVPDLLSCRNAIEEKLDNIGYSETVLEEGEHVIGISIQPGIYLLSVEVDSDGMAFICSEDGKITSHASLSYYSAFHATLGMNLETVTVELTEGQIIRIVSGPITLCTYDGI